MKALYDLPAPAKLNAFLHIVGQREDGYHLLQSVFVLIDWVDTLSFEVRCDGMVSRSDAGKNSLLALPENDLCVRAAKLLQQATGCVQGVHIELTKNIPIEAGLGGGSSDAAAVLIALNKLWKTKLNRDDLSKLAIKLGADVPFFIKGSNAWVEGVGDVLTPIDIAPQRFVVVKPVLGVSTKKIFSHPLLRKDTKSATMQSFASHAFGLGRNDMQEAAVAENHQISSALNYLKGFGWKPIMSGSGSAVFAVVQSGDEVVKSAVQGVPMGFTARSCLNLESHPLKSW